MSEPLAYFITIRTYGTWLAGDPRSAVDRRHNRYKSPRLPQDVAREHEMARARKHPPVIFGDRERSLVDVTMREVCRYRGWDIHALSVRTNHVHVVVRAPQHHPERVMNDLKAWATRRLRQAGLIGADAPVWADHGSTPHLYEADQLLAAIDYVLNRQDAKE